MLAYSFACSLPGVGQQRHKSEGCCESGGNLRMHRSQGCTGSDFPDPAATCLNEKTFSLRMQFFFLEGLMQWLGSLGMEKVDRRLCWAQTHVCQSWGCKCTNQTYTFESNKHCKCANHWTLSGPPGFAFITFSFMNNNLTVLSAQLNAYGSVRFTGCNSTLAPSPLNPQTKQ